MSRILPILFNTDMVQAILNERKTATRRIIKPEQLSGVGCMQCPNNTPKEFLEVRDSMFEPCRSMPDKELIGTIYKPRYEMGDILYVRETSKEAARIWLKVTDVRVERLQDIDGQEVLKEGINSHVHPKADYFNMNQREAFAELWNSTLKKADQDLYGWDANPWVWVIEFERCDKPEGWCV